jgi:signal transduction histidine kinase
VKKTDKNEAVLRESVRLAFRQIPMMQAASFMVALALCFSVRGIVPAPNIAAWIFGVFLISMTRLALFLRFAKIGSGTFDGARWEKTYILSGLVSGIVWGGSAFVIYPAGNTALIMLFVAVMTTLTAATTVSHSALRFGSAAWATPTMLLYSLRIYIDGPEYGHTLAMLFLLYTAAMFSYSLKNNDSIHDSISLRFDNMELLEEIKRAAEQKEKFISLVSHDLRSPLSGINGMLEIGLEQSEKDWIAMRETGAISQIIKTIDGLIVMVETLLNHSRLKAGKIWPQKLVFLAGPLVKKQIDGVLHAAKSKGITVRNELPEEMRICADPELFGRVMHNLLSNSVKFTPNGGTITVSKPWPDKSSIAVKDTGVGIKKEMHENLFSSDFQTTTFGTGGEKGTGLGLPYSFDIMNAHGGSLVFENDEEDGCVFIANFPNNPSTD